MLSAVTSVLACLNRSVFYWLAIILACIVMEATALYYQYVLDYGPCVLCVHIRAWVFAILVLAVFGLIFRNNKKAATGINVLSVIAAGGMVERAYLTLGIEKGFVDGSCSLNASFPSWLPLDQWVPSVFEPWEACGYTPEMLFSITMAEALMAISVLWVIAMLSMLASRLIEK